MKKRIKTMFSTINSLLKTFLTLVTFGLIKFNKGLRYGRAIELLEYQLETLRLQAKENMDLYIEYMQNRAVVKKRLEKLLKDRSTLVEKIKEESKSEEPAKLNILIAQYETLKTIIENNVKVLNNYDENIGRYQAYKNQFDIEVNRLNGQIEIIKADKDLYDIQKRRNNVTEKLYVVDNSHSSMNVEKLNTMLEENMLKEDIRANIINQNIDEKIRANKDIDIQDFLKELEDDDKNFANIQKHN